MFVTKMNIDHRILEYGWGYTPWPILTEFKSSKKVMRILYFKQHR
jgi:hypothetical protein